jgi:N-acetylmuramoyl-L-alanine amidase
LIGQDGAIHWPSANCGPRREGARPDMILLHYTAMQGAEAARDWLCDPQAEVSAHYVVGRDGTLWQLVCEDLRAWHAGAGGWGALRDVNSRSIGIEIANDGLQPFPEPQMRAVEALAAGIMARWGVPPERVLGHSDTAPGRKIDPGRRFDWRRLARQGLSIWPTRREPGDFWRDARRFGYLWEPGGEEAVLAAFRLRFRPGAEGPLSERDAAIMADLAARWPVANDGTLPPSSV